MVLKTIKTLLEQEEFECTLVSATQEVAVDRLLVFLGTDPKKRRRMLEIRENNQQLSPEFNLPKTMSFPYRVQFCFQFPFKVQDVALNQVASLLFFINQSIDLPGFELNEVKNQVLYRYMWIIYPSSIDFPLIGSILSSITLNLAIFHETIESLADGKLSFKELLTQMLATSVSPPLSSNFKSKKM